jgi:hypothetical protein
MAAILADSLVLPQERIEQADLLVNHCGGGVDAL